ELRDQGFTRPKVLILLPFKNNALEVVKMLIALSGSTQQDNKKRFFEEFGIDPADDAMDPKKPEDHKKMFAGNIDDCFRVGIKFSRKQLKLYSDFYSSDIILASPLGLRLVIGDAGQKKRDFDFLSAIEMVILDNTQVFMMQNWDHVQHIFDHMNLIPKDAHGCDFSRVRAYYLDGKAKYVRQTLMFTQFVAPEMNAMFTKNAKNVAGCVKVRRKYTGSIDNVVVQAPQMFYRIPVRTAAEADDARFDYFVQKIMPAIRPSGIQQKHTLVFIPSYFDFVRVRNYYDEHDYSFAQLSEYTSTADISRARSSFFHAQVPHLLTTERFHFFRRYALRGIRHIVFYALPEHPEYYPELVNLLDVAAEMSVTVAYSRFDRLRLERIVGSRRVAKMAEGEKESFMFA
ncbi:digestive organ expansion factor, partial [Blyttiomyces helicus]